MSHTTPKYDSDGEMHKDEDIEITYRNKGEALIAQRVLSTNPSLPTDNNRCENIVAEVMVEKLGLKLQYHPEPYQLTWLKKGNVVKVNHRCLVHFRIGSRYFDEVWCEVIPMDACHILLGVNIKLIPLDICESGTEALIVTRSEFLDFTRTTKPPLMFALVITEVNPTTVESPPVVKQLLQEFMDVLPTEISACLPLVCEIQHCIDFILGASIPNKLAYRMNPTEYGELQRQVTELLERGLIRESMSPCVVPSILVPK
uniref:Reverse transcriptase domain-containing protein n=1 Tax=Lactuca sativa TaxID=4236 RepID=A0A9R1V8A1_LACSA|nr:hypothetical protein LSAT_V11C600337720 [Lactuca sativa]